VSLVSLWPPRLFHGALPPLFNIGCSSGSTRSSHQPSQGSVPAGNVSSPPRASCIAFRRIIKMAMQLWSAVCNHLFVSPSNSETYSSVIFYHNNDIAAPGALTRLPTPSLRRKQKAFTRIISAMGKIQRCDKVLILTRGSIEFGQEVNCNLSSGQWVSYWHWGTAGQLAGLYSDF
jgi:hypothetical protein